MTKCPKCGLEEDPHPWFNCQAEREKPRNYGFSVGGSSESRRGELGEYYAENPFGEVSSD